MLYNLNIFKSINTKNLTVLDMSLCNFLSDFDSIDYIVKHENLRELNLCHIDVLSKSKDLTSYLVNNLPMYLEKLCLICIDCLSDSHVKALTNRCKNLVELDLFGCFDITKTSIIDIIRQSPELVKLDISLTKTGKDSAILRGQL